MKRLVSLLLLVCLAAACGEGKDSMVAGYLRRTHLTSAMIADLYAAGEAEKSAVLAETDRESQEYAATAREHVAALDASLAELTTLVPNSFDEETRMLQEFAPAWQEYRRVNESVLDLAVHNTNLKAMALANDAAAKAAARFEAALGRASAGCGTRDAVILAYKLQALLYPHIEEASDEAMTRIETQMSDLAAGVGASLTALAAAPGIDPAALAEARQAWDEFTKVTAEIVRLSRENTNVRSLALSLGQKRKAAAVCLELLTALNEKTRQRGLKAVR